MPSQLVASGYPEEPERPRSNGSERAILGRLSTLVDKLTLEVGRLNRRVRTLELERDARERVESELAHA